MKNYLILSALLAFVPATAQTSLGDYRQAVTEYSWELKVAASKSDAASQTMGQARTGYLPRLSLDGSFTATVHHYDGVERWNFSVLPQLVQTVYGGGAVRAAYKQAELGYDIALCDEEFTQLDVRYAAEYTYWNLSAMELYAASMRQYVNIIRSLKEVVDRRFAEGYIAKGDVLMIDARLSEAQYGLVSAEQNYTVALHNFNILRGTDPDLAVELAQGIRDSLPQPVRVLPDEVLAIPRLGSVNVHGSLLPKYRGAAPIQWAVLNGDEVTGVSTMYLAHDMDAGDIIYTEETPIGEYETAGELFDRLADMGAKLLVRTLRDIEAGTAPRTPQEHEKASYVKQLDKSICPIDWTRTPREVIKHICGLNPWPVATMSLGGDTLKVYKAEYTDNLSLIHI